MTSAAFPRDNRVVQQDLVSLEQQNPMHDDSGAPSAKKQRQTQPISQQQQVYQQPQRYSAKNMSPEMVSNNKSPELVASNL